jgi:sulfur carrier protein ThiS
MQDGLKMELTDETTLAAVLESLGPPADDETILLAVNGRPARPAQPLAHGAILAPRMSIPLVKGCRGVQSPG